MLQLSLTQPFHVKGVREAERIKLLFLTGPARQVFRLWQEGQALACLQGFGTDHRSAASGFLLSTSAERRPFSKFRSITSFRFRGKKWPSLSSQHCSSHNSTECQHRQPSIS